MKMFSWLMSLFLFLGSSPLHAKEKSHEILFVAFDTAETLVWKEMLQDNPSLSDKSSVLCMATSAKLASQGIFSFLAPDQIQTFDDSLPQRLCLLSKNTKNKISSLSPKCVVMGMYSTSLREVAEIFAEKNVPVLAFWDNPSSYPYLPDDLMANIEKIVNLSSYILCPTQEIANDLNNRFKGQKAIVVGHPSFDIQVAEILNQDTKELEQRLPWKKDRSLITYIGGFEENDNNYEESVRLFLEAVKGLGQAFDLVLQMHPRSDGSFETELIKLMEKENSTFPRSCISFSKRPFTSPEAVAIADIVVTHRSTMAFQAFTAGKKVLYVDVPQTRYSNLFIRQGLAEQMTSTENIKEAVCKLAAEDLTIDTLACPIPSGGKEKISQLILSLLHPSAEE